MRREILTVQYSIREYLLAMSLYFNQPDNDSAYYSKYGKFSNTFTKPLGISSMNFKLAS